MKEALFVGWFGPVGVAALLCAPETGDSTNAGSMGFRSHVVTCPVILHGVTSSYFSRKLSQNDREN